MPDATASTSSSAASAAADQQRSAKVLFGKYEVGRLLGCGAFAKVYHARHIPSGLSVALKVISKPKIVRGGLVANVKREIAVMRRLRHPHVVRLHEVLASRSRVYFVMEFARGGELFARLARTGRLPEDSARPLFRQLLSAVAFCHARGVFHRDLKPENLLLDEAGRLKVSDFGLSAVAQEQLRSDGLLHTLCGTPAYVAPEILSKKGYDGAKADIWSCGVILFVLNAGYLPFNDPNLMTMYRKIYRGDFKCPKWTSPELRRLIARLLDTNPDTRIVINDILHDPWFRDGMGDRELAAMMQANEELEMEMEDKFMKAAGDEGEEEERELNAFDIISFSPGFDLSGLFDPGRERERFVSRESAESVMDKVEEIARGEGLAVVRRQRRGGRAAAAVVAEGSRGELVAWLETYRMVAGLVVVVVEMGLENGRWGREFWRERLGPALNRQSTSEPGLIGSESDSGSSSGWMGRTGSLNSD